MDFGHSTPFVGHGNADSSASEEVSENLGLAVTVRGLFERGDAEVRLHGVVQLPEQNLAPGPVHDCHPVETAALHRNVGNLPQPLLKGE